MKKEEEEEEALVEMWKSTACVNSTVLKVWRQVFCELEQVGTDIKRLWLTLMVLVCLSAFHHLNTPEVRLNRFLSLLKKDKPLHVVKAKKKQNIKTQALFLFLAFRSQS